MSLKRKILIVIIILITIGINVYIKMNNQTTVVFHDNAVFAEFEDMKTERFILKKASTLHILYDCKIENGEIEVRIYDENKQEYYKNNELTKEEIVEIDLPAGTYFYDLALDGEDGEIVIKGTLK